MGFGLAGMLIQPANTIPERTKNCVIKYYYLKKRDFAAEYRLISAVINDVEADFRERISPCSVKKSLRTSRIHHNLS